MNVQELRKIAYIEFKWLAGTSFEEAVKTALTAYYQRLGNFYQDSSYNKLAFDFKVTSYLKINYDEVHRTKSDSPLPEFARYLLDLTQSVIKSAAVDSTGYPGVHLAKNYDGSVISLYDYTEESTEAPVKEVNKNAVKKQNENRVELKFTDLIGQPTWINPGVVQLKCVLRTDLNVSHTVLVINFNAQVTVTSKSAWVGKNSLNFSGEYRVNKLRHIGNFKGDDANDWITVIEASLNNA
jgi:hypothetical protein